MGEKKDKRYWPIVDELTVREVEERGKTYVYISDGVDVVRFTQFKRGVYNDGKKKPLDVIKTHRRLLKGMGLSDSAIAVMSAVSENEGNLDAVNTWDNSFMSFGMFQWTAGAGKEPGELAALLEKIKVADPEVFQSYFGQYGLDLNMANTISGYITIGGESLVSPVEKERLRAPEWAFHFWRSGQDLLVQTVQILHALSRIKTFYRSRSYRPNGYYISDLITSEYGVGLVLDHHVERPGYVKACIAAAMNQLDLPDPEEWGTEEEMRLIKEYLKVRADYGKFPMTDADKRARVTRKYLNNGHLSSERGSFRYSEL